MSPIEIAAVARLALLPVGVAVGVGVGAGVAELVDRVSRSKVLRLKSLAHRKVVVHNPFKFRVCKDISLCIYIYIYIHIYIYIYV